MGGHVAGRWSGMEHDTRHMILYITWHTASEI
jgi:hypothetical protein